MSPPPTEAHVTSPRRGNQGTAVALGASANGSCLGESRTLAALYGKRQVDPVPPRNVKWNKCMSLSAVSFRMRPSTSTENKPQIGILAKTPGPEEELNAVNSATRRSRTQSAHRSTSFQRRNESREHPPARPADGAGFPWPPVVRANIPVPNARAFSADFHLCSPPKPASIRRPA